MKCVYKLWKTSTKHKLNILHTVGLCGKEISLLHNLYMYLVSGNYTVTSVVNKQYKTRQILLRPTYYTCTSPFYKHSNCMHEILTKVDSNNRKACTRFAQHSNS